MLAGKPVYITGAGCISAVGMNLAEHTTGHALKRQNASPVPSSLFKTALKHPVFAVNGPPLSNPAAELARHALIDIGRLGRTQCLFLSALAESLAGAGFSRRKLADLRVGIAVGTTVGATFTDHEGYFSWKNSGIAHPQGIMDFFGRQSGSACSCCAGYAGAGIGSGKCLLFRDRCPGACA